MSKRKKLMKAFVIIVLVGFILSSWILTMFMYGNNDSQEDTTQPNEVKYSWAATGINNTGSVEISIETGDMQ